MIRSAAGESIRRFQLSLVLTHACNLRCSYCYMGEHHAAAMTEAVAFRAIDAAFERAPSVQVSFFGGEPLLAWDLLAASAARARRISREIGAPLVLQVTTNGTLLSEPRAATLAEHGVEVAVSLDGDGATQDACRPAKGGGSSFEAVLRGIDHLRAASIAFDVIAVTSPRNVARLAHNIELIASLGPRRIVMSPAFEAPWDDATLAVWEGELARVAELYADGWRAGRRVRIAAFDGKLAAAARGRRDEASHCGAGRWNIAVAPSGHLYPCDRLVGDDRFSRFAMGTLDDGLELRCALARGPTDPECDACEERFRCGATCACSNIAETGRPDRPGGVQCWYERTVAGLADELGWALLREGNADFVEVAYGGLAASRVEMVDPALAMRRTHPASAREDGRPGPRRLPTVKA